MRFRLRWQHSKQTWKRETYKQMAKIYGYELDDVDNLAAQIFELIAEHEIPNTQALLILCRTITMLSTSDDDLDMAVAMIDRIKEELEAEAEFQMADEEEEDGQN